MKVYFQEYLSNDLKKIVDLLMFSSYLATMHQLEGIKWLLS